MRVLIGMGLPDGMNFEQQAADLDTEVVSNHDAFRILLVKHFTHELQSRALERCSLHFFIIM